MALDKKSMERLSRIIKKDERFERLKAAFIKLPQYSLPFGEYKDELKLMHSQRTLGKMDARSPKFVRSISDAATTDHAFRSRITEILVECASVNNSLSKTLQAFERYALYQYASDLKGLSTKDERKAFIEGLLSKFYSYLADVEEMVQICRYYIDNIDKGGYVVRELVEAHKILSKFDPG